MTDPDPKAVNLQIAQASKQAAHTNALFTFLQHCAFRGKLRSTHFAKRP